MNELNLNAWIEINVFGKSVFSEKRGEYEFFCFSEPDNLNRKGYAPRDWNDYDFMKHILPDSQPRRFTSDADASFELLKKLPYANYITIYYNNQKWFIDNLRMANGEEIEVNANTLQLAIALFAKKLFNKP